MNPTARRGTLSLQPRPSADLQWFVLPAHIVTPRYILTLLWSL